MGSKRVGLARMEALVENLKRELAMDGASFSGLAQSKITVMSSAAGADLADDTATVNFARGDHGEIHKCLLDGAGKTLNLPASTAAADVGLTITVIQGANLVASGVLTINANTGNTFTANGYIVGHASSATTLERPAEANNRLVITGANTNSAWGIGSRITFTCVAAGEWLMEGKAEPLGNGSAAFAFSTV